MKHHKAPIIARAIHGKNNAVITQSNQPMGLEYST